MAFELPELPYAFDALEPHIDARTMEIHYGKHHAGYTKKLNAAVEGTDLANMKIEDILANVSKHSTAVRNNGGGYYNHSLFWSIMEPTAEADGEPTARMNIHKAIERDFGSFDNFKSEFSKAAATRFGSGWAWLCVDKNDKLFICSTANQDNPLMDVVDEEGVLETRDVNARFVNGKPEAIESIYIMKNPEAWDRFMRFMERYGESNGLVFTKAN